LGLNARRSAADLFAAASAAEHAARKTTMTTVASHPANELDNPFDDIDDSSLSFDNDPIVIELVANAFDQITHDIQMDTAPHPPPPVVTPTDPPVQGVNYEVCREKLNEYFLKRFTDNTCELWK
jgi:hypothetical protein